MNPNQSRAARAMLKFSIDHVCKNAPIGKRTLVEFEAGSRKLNSVTYSNLKSFYLMNGIYFENKENYVTVKCQTEKLEMPIDPIRNALVIEYPSYLKISELSENIDLILEKSDASLLLLPISTKLIISTMKLKNVNQKYMADKLGCSLAFFNAVILGQKKLPVRMATVVETVLGIELDLASIILTESKLDKLFNEIKLASSKSSLLQNEIESYFKKTI